MKSDKELSPQRHSKDVVINVNGQNETFPVYFAPGLATDMREALEDLAAKTFTTPEPGNPSASRYLTYIGDDGYIGLIRV